MGRVARTTVTEATTGDQVTTPIIISESEASSQMSSDLESLESPGPIIRCGLNHNNPRYHLIQIKRGQAQTLGIEDGLQRRLEQQPICESLPSKRRHIQPPAYRQVDTVLTSCGSCKPYQSSYFESGTAYKGILRLAASQLANFHHPGCRILAAFIITHLTGAGIGGQFAHRPSS
jgi:hypothetical protein